MVICSAKTVDVIPASAEASALIGEDARTPPENTWNGVLHPGRLLPPIPFRYACAPYFFFKASQTSGGA